MPGQADTTVETTLSSYLNDHLAGSRAAIHLVGNIRDENEGTPLGDLMGRLGTAIESDRDTLEGLMSRLGIEPSSAKQAAGWMLERLSRLRFAERVTGSAATSRLMQLEMLSIGIEGKRLLWKALQELAQAASVFEGVDFDSLIARADSQRQEVEPFRLEAAREGLAA
jgi:hypothetical protein